MSNAIVARALRCVGARALPCLLWVLGLMGAGGPAAAAAPTAADYARWPEVMRMVVSPSNDRVAMLVRSPKGRVALAIADLGGDGKPRLLAAYDDVDVREVDWINDKRLVYSVWQEGPRIEYDKWGSFAVDHDGSNERHLISARSDNEATGSNIKFRVLTRQWDYWKPVGDGSDDVYVRRMGETADRGYSPLSVSRVDTRTLRLTPVTEGQPDQASAWLFDASGRLAVVVSEEKNRNKLWWQPAAGEPWKLVREWDDYGDNGVTPRALERDGTLIVSARIGRDTSALYTFDLRKGQADPTPLVGVDGYDVDRAIFDAKQQAVIGVRVEAQQPTTVWFDEGLARAQAAVDKALPGRSNRLQCGHCVGARRFIVHSSSDRQPGEYYLFDAAAGRLQHFAATRPWIAEATQGRRSYHRIAARDGLVLPVVVTHPASAPAGQPAPTVVLVHGGPWVDGSMVTWEAEPQYLASLGYRVLQVSYRGTTGLGWKHFRASWGQFGLTMQDDLEDALQWAVKEKLTDADRACIYGASYGGYAALMGPVRHPGRYRCAVSHVGVTELSLMFSRNWTDISPVGRQHGWGKLVGDPDRDAERLRQQSPVHRVAEIKVPVLVAQGRLDRRVTPEHADRFVSAARSAGVAVERVDYEEGHGFYRPESQADFWSRLAVFLEKSLAPR